MNITKIAEKRVKNNNLSLEKQEKKLEYISNKNSLEAKTIMKVITLLKYENNT